jgi:hypothetical protein
VQQVAASWDDGVAQLIQLALEQNLLACRVHCHPSRHRPALLRALGANPTLSQRLSPHTFTHYLSILELGPDLVFVGTMPAADALTALDVPWCHQKSAGGSTGEGTAPEAPPQPHRQTAAEAAAAATRAPSETLRKGRTDRTVPSGLSYQIQGHVSRAAAKLKELFEGRPNCISLPEGCKALDIGAAPGGWTEVTLQGSAAGRGPCGWCSSEGGVAPPVSGPAVRSCGGRGSGPARAKRHSAPQRGLRAEHDPGRPPGSGGGGGLPTPTLTLTRLLSPTAGSPSRGQGAGPLRFGGLRHEY